MGIFAKREGMRLAAMLLCVGMAASAVGCGKSAAPTATPTDANSVAGEALTMQPGVFSKAGTYTEPVDGDVVVETSGVILSGLTISGDLVLAETIGEGDVTLEDITVKGDTIIRGGGSHSVKAVRSTFGKVLLEKQGSPVRLFTQETQIKELTVANSAILDGTFQEVKCNDGSSVSITGDVTSLSLLGAADVTLKTGHVSSILLAEGDGKAQLKLEANTQVDALTVLCPAQVVLNGTVKQAKFGERATGATVTGTGTMEKTTGSTGHVTISVEKQEATPPQSSGYNSGARKQTPPAKQPQTPVPPVEQGASGDTNPPQTTPPAAPAISIAAVESVRNGLVRVTLSAATPAPLGLSSFSILCTGGGKDMTIQQVKTTDNRVYDLVTAYYNDNSYNVQVTLPDGRRLDKDFVSKYDCPEIRSTVMRRTAAAQAKFLFYSDSDGTFHYLLQATPASRQRSAAQEPTAEAILRDGTSTPMQRQGNMIAIDGLTEGVGYTVYYVAKGSDETVTPVKSIVLSGEVEQNQQGSITVTDAKGFAVPGADFADELCGFTITLSEPTIQPLTLDAFEISCPASGIMSIGRVVTQDNQTYSVYMQPGYMFISNNTMTARITFPNGDYTTYDFYVDIEAPTTGLVSIAWTDATTAEASFSASEAGWIYYAILDSVSDTIGTKDPAFLFAQGEGVTKAPLTTNNRIVLTGAVADKYFCYATEDALGNRIEYMGYDKIPAYVPPEPPPEEDELAITSVVYSLENNQPTFRIAFNQEFNVTTMLTSETAITGSSGRPLFQRDSISGTNAQEVTLRILNGVTVASGEQTITITVGDKTLTSIVTIP